MRITGMTFSSPMVLELLVEARKPGTGKRQTRRVLSYGNTWFDGYKWPKDREARDLWDWGAGFVDPGPSPAGNPGPYLHLPYIGPNPDYEGMRHRIYPRLWPGDLAYVRETFAKGHPGAPEHECCARKADWRYACGAPMPEGVKPDRWITPRFMPRLASRLTVEIVRVRIERLQDMSQEDALAEGVLVTEKNRHMRPQEIFRDEIWDPLLRRRGFGWDVNPWVLVYDLRVIERNIVALAEERGISDLLRRTERRSKAEDPAAA